MGIGSGLAFIALGAILAFAFHVHLSHIDIHMIGWIFILIGIVMLGITLLYTRPRRKREVVNVADSQPGAYVADVEEPPLMSNPNAEVPVQPVQQPVQQQPVQPVQQPPVQPDPRRRPR